MEIVELIAEGDKVVGRFTCSATHLGEWLGHAPTGRRFERLDEVAIFRFWDGRIVHAWSLEDTLGRLRQLGLTPRPASRRQSEHRRSCRKTGAGCPDDRDLDWSAVIARGWALRARAAAA